MKAKEKILAVLTVSALAVCLSACGNSEDTEQKTGTVSVATTAPDSTEATTTASETPEVTTAPEEVTTAPEEVTTVEETTTPAPETDPPQQEEKPDPDSFSGKTRISYNGYEFGVGDKISEVESHLGAQPGPPSEVTSCLGDGIVDEYYFYGMTIQAKDDVIFSIDIMDNAYYGDITPKTAAGLEMMMTKSDMESLYGASTSSDDFNYYYTEGTVTMQITVIEDTVWRIWVNDSSLG